MMKLKFEFWWIFWKKVNISDFYSFLREGMHFTRYKLFFGFFIFWVFLKLSFTLLHTIIYKWNNLKKNRNQNHLNHSTKYKCWAKQSPKVIFIIYHILEGYLLPAEFSKNLIFLKMVICGKIILLKRWWIFICTT